MSPTGSDSALDGLTSRSDKDGPLVRIRGVVKNT